MTITIIQADANDVLAHHAAGSVDAIVTDPPYELGFMKQRWDATGISYNVTFWERCFEILKPGGWLLAFSATRTYHRMACAIEDAGGEIRDCIAWTYGSGMPKSLDISKAFDKDVQRPVIGRYTPPGAKTWNLTQAGESESDHRPGSFTASGTRTLERTAPVTDLAREWDGWGTVLKPCFEPICVARKPLVGTYCENLVQYRIGALNIGESLIDGMRWPGNLILQHSPDCVHLGQRRLKNKSGSVKAEGVQATNYVYSPYGAVDWRAHGDEQGIETIEHWDCVPDCAVALMDSQKAEAARYFTRLPIEQGDYDPFIYIAKATTRERNAGLDHFPTIPNHVMTGRPEHSSALASPRAGTGRKAGHKNIHKTVKPVALMEHLLRLCVPEGGLVVDPFIGSGTTAVAAVKRRLDFWGCDSEADYVEIARARVAHAEAHS